MEKYCMYKPPKCFKGMTMENYTKTIGKPLDNYGKPWDSCGKPWETIGNRWDNYGTGMG